MRWQIRTDLRKLAIDACAEGPLSIAAAGGKGGVGTSLLLANLGVFLAQIGNRILLVDLARGGGNLHSMIGHAGDAPAETAGDGDSPDRFAETTPISGLDVIPARPADRRRSPRLGWKRWREEIARLAPAYDGFLFDCGTWPRREELDLFVHAYSPVVVIVPEPTSVDSTLGLLLEATRRFLAHDPSLGALVRRTLSACRGALPTPAELLERIADTDETAAASLARRLARFRPGLVVNQVRVKADFDLGLAVESVARRVLGVPLQFVGAIESDDAVWKTIRHGRPLLVDAPTSRSAKEIERIARRLLAPEGAAPGVRPGLRRPGRTENLYEALEVDPGATDDEVRRAYRRLREVYSTGHIATRSHVGAADMRRIQARVEEAYETLTDVSRRRPYDRGLKEAAGRNGPGPAVENDAAQAGFTGATLREARRGAGMEREDLAAAAHVGGVYIRAIEEEEFGALPEEVYLRGYLRQVARALGLPERDVAEGYLRRYRWGRRKPDRGR